MIAMRSIFAAAAMLGLAAPAGAGGHDQYLASVATYKPMAGFNHVVGDVRFVGYFLAGPDRCDVTVFTAGADDERLASPPRKLVIQIAAGGRSELDAGPDQALAIACTADADAIKVAPQTTHPHEARL